LNAGSFLHFLTSASASKRRMASGRVSLLIIARVELISGDRATRTLQADAGMGSVREFDAGRLEGPPPAFAVTQAPREVLSSRARFLATAEACVQSHGQVWIWGPAVADSSPC
jgi:hypothetical protein